MSQVSTQNVSCPHCNHEQNFTFWNSLNANLDPDAKQSLMDGSLFRFKCEKCGYEANVNYNILYHDMDHDTMVYLVDANSTEDVAKVMSAMSQYLIADKDASGVSAELAKTRNRVVANANRLREKAIILDAGLDDRIVEIVKLLCWMEAVKEIPDVKEDELYFNVSDDGTWIVQVLGRGISCNVPKTMYDGIYSQFMPIFDKIGDNELVVDHNFAGIVCKAYNDAHKEANDKKQW